MIIILKKTFVTLVIVFFMFNLNAQDNEKKIIPFLKTGYGYFNEELLIDGNILSSEIGIKMENNYLFSLKMNFADAVNDIANYPELTNIDWNFIYSYKWVSLNMGYDFRTKNQRHSFIPMLGIYYANELITYPLGSTEDEDIELVKDVREMVGIEISLQYLYNFKNGISAGLNASGCLAYEYGPVYYTIMPVVCFQLK